MTVCKNYLIIEVLIKEHMTPIVRILRMPQDSIITYFAQVGSYVI